VCRHVCVQACVYARERECVCERVRVSECVGKMCVYGGALVVLLIWTHQIYCVPDSGCITRENEKKQKQKQKKKKKKEEEEEE
jgi:hypothetical protein